MINTLQLVVLVPNFNLSFPGNVVVFYQMINSLTKFDVLPTTKMEDAMFTFSQNSDTPDPIYNMDIFSILN